MLHFYNNQRAANANLFALKCEVVVLRRIPDFLVAASFQLIYIVLCAVNLSMLYVPIRFLSILANFPEFDKENNSLDMVVYKILEAAFSSDSTNKDYELFGKQMSYDEMKLNVALAVITVPLILSIIARIIIMVSHPRTQTAIMLNDLDYILKNAPEILLTDNSLVEITTMRDANKNLYQVSKVLEICNPPDIQSVTQSSVLKLLQDIENKGFPHFCSLILKYLTIQDLVQPKFQRHMYDVFFQDHSRGGPKSFFKDFTDKHNARQDINKLLTDYEEKKKSLKESDPNYHNDIEMQLPKAKLQ